MIPEGRKGQSFCCIDSDLLEGVTRPPAAVPTWVIDLKHKYARVFQEGRKWQTSASHQGMRSRRTVPRLLFRGKRSGLSKRRGGGLSPDFLCRRFGLLHHLHVCLGRHSSCGLSRSSGFYGAASQPRDPSEYHYDGTGEAATDSSHSQYDD